MSDLQNIHPVDFEEALGERYLAYALSTIMARSLPDVRDGLKPVHRRLLYAMYQLKLDPTAGFKKCARVVGDVMGKFHPHGDAAIYGALVRLAQDFSVRYPLIEGQGNFGNIDGDGAAAMRYTEARLSDVAMSLLEGLEESSVDFRSTYDREGEEPVVFPSSFPNLLANGSTGIAVGMATSIPPHNVEEICQALAYLIDHPLATCAHLLRFMPGPDFPTGGLLADDQETILKAYETGRGSFRLRSQWEKEDQRGGGYRLVIKQIPYQVEKSKLIERIATLLNTKKLPLLEDIWDESTDEVRLVLQPRNRTTDPALLMETLFRCTDLEVRISLNMNVLNAQNVPSVMSLRDVLLAFLDHRFAVQKRRSQHRLDQIAARLELLQGYLVVYLNLDEVIRIIRDEDEPKVVLSERFSLSLVQVEAILNMRLRSLRKLQEIEIRKERDQLQREQSSLSTLLASPEKQGKKIQEEVRALGKRFGQKTLLGRRRTQIGSAPTLVDLSQAGIVEKEDVTIILSQKNWLRSVKGHSVKAEEVKYKEGDSERFLLTAQTSEKLVLFATNGRFYTLSIDKIQRTRGNGNPLRLMIELENTEEILTAFVMSEDPSDRSFLLVSEEGRGFLVLAKDVIAQTRVGKQVLLLDAEEKAKYCLLTAEGESVALIGENRKMIIFPLAEIPTMSRGKGVALQKYGDGKLSDMTTFYEAEGLSWIRKGKKVTERDLRLWQGKRGGKGRLAPVGFPRNNKFEG